MIRSITPNKMNKALEFVSASSNLKGTVNEIKANRMMRDVQFVCDRDTFAGRVASFKIAKSPIEMVKTAPKAEIVPEDSINFIC